MSSLRGGGNERSRTERKEGQMKMLLKKFFSQERSSSCAGCPCEDWDNCGCVLCPFSQADELENEGLDTVDFMAALSGGR